MMGFFASNSWKPGRVVGPEEPCDPAGRGWPVRAAAEVGAGAERSAVSCDDRHADVVPVSHLAEGLDQGGAKFAVDGVHLFGAVQRDGRDSIIHFENDW
jgi:hypothetical protein